MDEYDPNDPDQQAAQMIRYTLTCNGFTIDLLTVDKDGVRVSAHRPSTKGAFLTKPGFKELA